MRGENGLVAAIIAWRGFLALAVPLVNTKLQSKFTEILVASPNIANSIVQNKTYQAVALILKITIGISLPSQSSVLVHQVNVAAQMGDTGTFDKAEIKPQ